MCMGFGCNAAGVVGCRIIDSPRERLLAVLTNSFVPCNGRFPTLIALITMFFVGTGGTFFDSVLSAVLLTGVIVLGVAVTFLTTRFLSATILKGVPSSFTLELPPYRRPQIGKVIIRSVMERTLFVLGRAAAVAAPAGMLLWIMANVTVGGTSLLAICSGFLDPFARLMGRQRLQLQAADRVDDENIQFGDFPFAVPAGRIFDIFSGTFGAAVAGIIAVLAVKPGTAAAAVKET